MRFQKDRAVFMFWVELLIINMFLMDLDGFIFNPAFWGFIATSFYLLLHEDSQHKK